MTTTPRSGTNPLIPSDTAPRSRLFRLKTHPLVHGAVHGVRRRRGRAALRRLPAGRTPAETAVRSALREALHSRPDDPVLQRIEQLRAEYLASDVWLADAPRGKTSTLAGAASVSQPARNGWLLHLLVRHLGATTVVETGTCVGLSAAYQAAALPDDGRLVTLELLPDLAARARSTFAAVGVDTRAEVVVGDIDAVLPGVVTTLPRVDFAFVDGGHFLERVVRVTDVLLERAHEGTVVVLDDITWSDEMRQAWRRVCADPRFAECLDLGGTGVAVVGRPDLPHRVLAVPYA